MMISLLPSLGQSDVLKLNEDGSILLTMVVTVESNAVESATGSRVQFDSWENVTLYKDDGTTQLYPLTPAMIASNAYASTLPTVFPNGIVITKTNGPLVVYDANNNGCAIIPVAGEAPLCVQVTHSPMPSPEQLRIMLAASSSVYRAKSSSVSGAIGHATDRELIYALARLVLDENKAIASRICAINPASANTLGWIRDMNATSFKSNITARLP
jgi:hypothetical protein